MKPMKLDVNRLRMVLRDRCQWTKLVIGAVVGVVFLVGLITVAEKITAWLPDLPRWGQSQNQSGTIKVAQVLDVAQADFAYFVPGKDDAWKYDEKSPAFDKTTGVVKYNVVMKYAEVNVTISQQKFPAQLEPRGGKKFMEFVNGSNPVRSQDIGRGTVYFLAALENGVQANGSDTIIYATDGILMFGKAGRVIGYEGWSKFIASMKLSR